MSRFIAMTLPLLPGKESEWRQFVHELQGDHRQAYAASRRRLGIRERSFFQSTAAGGTVIVTLEGENAAGAFQKLAQSDTPFSRWYFEKLEALHGITILDALLMPPPQAVLDSGPVLEKTGALFAPSAS
jgi:hypothetical protein